MKKSQPQPKVAPELRRHARAALKRQPRADTGRMALTRLVRELDVQHANLALQNADLQATRLQLAKTAERYSELYDFTPVAYLTLQPDGRIRQANLTAARVLGLARSHLLGRRFAAFVAPEARTAFAALLARTFARKAPEVGEVRLAIQGKPRLTFQLQVHVPAEEQECRLVLMDVTEPKRLETILAARVRLMLFAQTHSLAELLRATLDEAELLTGSCIGFYHFLEADQTTLSLQAWSTNTERNLCRAEGAGQHYPVAQAGVWADCIGQRRPVIHNDYASLPHRKGLPPGHAPVQCQLVVPVLRGGQVTAILGVGNKSTDYLVEDIDTIATLADLAWDIAERMRAEAALRDAGERYRGLFEAVSDAVLVIDLETLAILEANPAALALYGYGRAEILGLNATDMSAEPKATSQAIAACAARVPLRWHRKKDGTVFPVEISGSYFSYRGRPAHLVAIRDITQRQQMQAQVQALLATVQEERDKLSALVNSITDEVWFTDTQGRFTLANPAARREFQLADGSSIRLADLAQSLEVLRPDGSPRPVAEAPPLRALVGEVITAQEEIVRTPGTGQQRHRQVSSAPVRDANGQIVGAVSVVRDITERKAAEAAVHQLSARLQQAQDEERRRVARELHDTSVQSLAALTINLGLLAEAAPGLSGWVKQLLEDSVALAQQCAREVRTSSYLLHPPVLDALGLAGAVRDHADGFARRSGLRVDLELPPDLGRLPQATELALFRILQEALSNIHRHSGSRTASITLAQTADQIRLEVRDQGHGLDARTAPARHRGAGIPGMEERMRQLGGQLEIVSSQLGTAVIATLPRPQPPPPP
jgi:PAS domain S-box-containing protein